MIFIKKPLVFALSLLAVIGMISFVSFSSSSSLGDSSPISLQKYSEQQAAFDVNSNKGGSHVPNQKAQVKTDREPESKSGGERRPTHKTEHSSTKAAAKTDPEIDDVPLAGEYTETAFMPKMANETLKAQLGNAAWKLFHTILARYPDTPSKQERSTLKSYILLFAQVYPCGDCARHFQKLLEKYPPQTKSRKTAALWGCDIHNKVNDKLGKPEYDCTTILEDYDCGCGSDEKEEDSTLGNESIDHLRNVEVKKEGKQLG